MAEWGTGSPFLFYGGYMSIIRTEKTENYSVMCNEALKRKDLSARAKGIFAYLMTLPNDWKLHKDELFKHFTEGRDALNKAFMELQNNGYIEKNVGRKRDGKVNGWDFTVHEKVPYDWKPVVRKNRRTENQLLLNTEPKLNTNNTIINNSIYSSNELDSFCLKIIRHINSLNVFNRIKLPSDYKNNKVTKKLLTLIKYLQSLKSGTFLKIVNIDSKWRKENNIKIEPISSLERTINKIINKYKQMLNDKDIWPSNKKILTKDLLEFFYNPESKRSYLLYCLCNDIKYIDKVLKTTIGNKIKNSLPAEVQKAGDILFKDGFDLKSFWFNIKQVYEWYVKNKDGLKEHNDKIHENCGYSFLTYVGKIDLFFNEYILFLKSKIGEYSIGNIGINKTFNNWFIPYCWDRDDPFALDFTKRKNPYEQYEETTEDLYDFGEIEAVI